VSVSILTGDCRAILASLPAESVHCVVTSPPYWGLRDYGTAKWEGGDVGCDHIETMNAGADIRLGLKKAAEKSDGRPRTDKPPRVGVTDYGRQFQKACGKCGATRIDSQLGLEQTPAEYVEQMVQVFREVRRVLRKDGTLWLNLGDSYASNPASGGSKSSGLNAKRDADGTLAKDNKSQGITPTDKWKRPNGLKPKDLVGIPWMVAFALRADGWWLRQDIIWAKPNPMPESVTDRCTKAHEYLFLLTKSASYYYDAEAIAEDIKPEWIEHYKKYAALETVEPKQNADRNDGGTSETQCGFAKPTQTTRNKRSVWTVTTQPFAEAHFATFPPALIEPCILAGCPKDGTVLDPFGGAGTTGLVADRQQRNAILIELNPAYAAMARNRIYNDAPLFANVT
jgi:DNA modification methylase